MMRPMARDQDYHQAFRLFLEHTDEKTRAQEWLDRLVASLPFRRNFVDAGAGTGEFTAWLADRFETTLALEPNGVLCEELRRACPGIEVRQTRIIDASPSAPADLVLCSHVLYYIPPPEWQVHVDTMASWLSPQGELVIVLQSPDTDYMEMLAYFHQRRFDLRAVAGEFEQAQGGRYHTQVERVPAQVTTADLESAVAIAEFMMDVVHVEERPPRRELEAYVTDRFAAGGGYRFSCDQDFLRVAPGG
jgi:trans-aconitate methyltransferase